MALLIFKLSSNRTGAGDSDRVSLLEIVNSEHSASGPKISATSTESLSAAPVDVATTIFVVEYTSCKAELFKLIF